MSHPSAHELELYVIAGLRPVRATEVEVHVSGCDRCAGALAAEARFDLFLEDVARAGAGAPRKEHARRERRKPGLVATALVAAAAALLFIAGTGRNQPLPPPARSAGTAPPAADAGLTIARDDGGELER